MKNAIKALLVIVGLLFVGGAFAQPIAQKAVNKGVSCMVVTADGHRDYFAKSPAIERFETLRVLNCFATAFRHKKARVAAGEAATVSPVNAEMLGIRCWRDKDVYIVQFRDNIPERIEKHVVSCLIQAEHEYSEKLKDPRWL